MNSLLIKRDLMKNETLLRRIGINSHMLGEGFQVQMQVARMERIPMEEAVQNIKDLAPKTLQSTQVDTI